MTFQTSFNYLDHNKDVYGLYLQFDHTIQVTRTNFVMNSLNMVSQIGGIIGVGKELFGAAVIFVAAASALIKLSMLFFNNQKNL